MHKCRGGFAWIRAERDPGFYGPAPVAVDSRTNPGFFGSKELLWFS